MVQTLNFGHMNCSLVKQMRSDLNTFNYAYKRSEVVQVHSQWNKKFHFIMIFIKMASCKNKIEDLGVDMGCKFFVQ